MANIHAATMKQSKCVMQRLLTLFTRNRFWLSPFPRSLKSYRNRKTKGGGRLPCAQEERKPLQTQRESDNEDSLRQCPRFPATNGKARA